jgi:hypothetical protein
MFRQLGKAAVTSALLVLGIPSSLGSAWAADPDCGNRFAQVEKASATDQDLAAYEEAYLNKKDGGGLTVLDKIGVELKPDPVLTKAEQAALGWYTLSYQMEPRILLAAAKKLPPKKGKFFRGEKIADLKIKKEGQVVTLDRLYSVSTDKSVAEGFVNPDKPSELLFIKAKTAKDISSYSLAHPEGVDEREHFLLPGTQLKVDKFSEGTVTFMDEETGEDVNHKIRYVYLSEI